MVHIAVAQLPSVSFCPVCAVVKRYSDELEERQLFQFSTQSPFKPGQGWLAWALLGMVAAPVVVGVTAATLSATGYDSLVTDNRGTVDGVVGMISIDFPTYARLLVVTGVLAPILEESLFRGFLLTSLTRVMPTWAAVAVSSTAFGLAHLSIKDLPVLIALGSLLGVLYVRSRNLLTPMIVHGAWNSTVLTLLFWLAASGIDVQQLIQQGHL